MCRLHEAIGKERFPELNDCGILCARNSVVQFIQARQVRLVRAVHGSSRPVGTKFILSFCSTPIAADRASCGGGRGRRVEPELEEEVDEARDIHNGPRASEQRSSSSSSSGRENVVFFLAIPKGI